MTSTYSIVDMENARLAGFFDGEGTVCIHTTSGGRQALNVSASQLACNDEPLRSLAKMYGGSVRPEFHPERRQMNRWIASGNNAFCALLAMFPYLQVKRRQAFIGLVFQRYITYTKTTRRYGTFLTQEEIKARQALQQMCRFFNRRGKTVLGMAPVKQGVLAEEE